MEQVNLFLKILGVLLVIFQESLAPNVSVHSFDQPYEICSENVSLNSGRLRVQYIVNREFMFLFHQETMPLATDIEIEAAEINHPSYYCINQQNNK